MISVPLTLAITAVLAMFGITPSAWLMGIIFIVLKVAIGLGLAGGLMKLFSRKKPAPEEPTPTAQPPSS